MHINNILQTLQNGLDTFETTKEEIIRGFAAKECVLARFGQKSLLTQALQHRLDQLSQQLTVDVALAFETSVENSYLSPSPPGQKQESCFPFLFSVSAVNILNRDSRSVLEGTYRIIAYNTLQHVKKKKDIGVSLVANGSLNLLENIESQVESVLQFVHSNIEDKIASNSYRLECYCSIGRARDLAFFKERMIAYFSTLTVMKLPVTTVSLAIGTMTRSMQVALKCFASRSTFSNCYILLNLYYRFLSGIFCLEPMTRKYLEAGKYFGLDPGLFDTPFVRLNLMSLEKINLDELVGVGHRLFQDSSDIGPVLALSRILEVSSYYNSPIMADFCKRTAVLLGGIFYSDFEAGAIDWGSVEYVPLHEFLVKESAWGSSMVKRMSCSLLRQLAEKPEIFDAIVSELKDRTLLGKANGKLYCWRPICNTCNIQYLRFIVSRYGPLTLATPFEVRYQATC